MTPKIITPSVPNFVKVEMGDQAVTLAIHQFSEAELRTIGEQWTNELIIRAKRLKRNN